MASVTGSRSSKETQKISNVNISAAANGVTVREEYVPKPRRNGLMDWQPTTPKDIMLFESYEECMTYIGNCIKPLFTKAGKA